MRDKVKGKASHPVHNAYTSRTYARCPLALFRFACQHRRMSNTTDPLKPKRTRREAVEMYYLNDVMERVECDLHRTVKYNRCIPYEWHAIHKQRDFAKTRITLRVDKDVLKFFRAMGPGYQPRMNDVLCAFMRSKLAGLLEGEETVTEYRDARWAERRRPEFGDVEKTLES